MTHQSNKDDTKLLVAVAGLVLAGAAGLAIIAGLSSDDESSTKPTARKPGVANPAVETRSTAVIPTGEAVGSSSRDDAILPAGYSPAKDEAPPEPIVDESVVAEVVETEPEFQIEPGENLVAGGLAAWSARDFPRAAAYFRAQTEARESDAWAHYMLGLSLWKDGRLVAAAEAMNVAIAHNPDSIKSRINLSRIENDRGEFQAALAAAESALAIDPESATALFLKGRSLRNLGEVDAGIESLEASLEFDQDNGFVHNLVGLMRIERGDLDLAVVAMTRASDLEPGVAYIQNNLGMALERTGDREGALVAYRRAVELDGSSPNATMNLARLEPTVPGPTPLDAPSEDHAIAIASASGSGDDSSSDERD